MKVICSYCQKDMGEKEPFDEDRLSHGICLKCKEYLLNQMDGMPLEKYIGNFDFPVIIIDENYRVLAINDEASKLTNKATELPNGLLGGEMMECTYARRPEGCGNSFHCESCTIRRAVMSVMKDGLPIKHLSVQLTQDKQTLDMIISAKKIDGVVQLIIEKVQGTVSLC